MGLIKAGSTRTWQITQHLQTVGNVLAGQP